MADMAHGLFGHEYEMYPYVNQSSWLQPRGHGGSEYSSLNEGLPYWFNSMVPLAFTLGSDALQKQVTAVARRVLDLQDPDGWIGPEDVEDRNFWARIPFFLGLTQLAEVDHKWEEDIVRSLRSFMILANTMLKDNSRGFVLCSDNVDCSWGQARAHDMIITIQWLLDRPHLVVHDAEFLQVLWENMDMFYAQNPMKWDDWYTNETYPKVVNPHNQTIIPYTHGVNVGQGLKASAVIYRINGTQSLVQKSYDAVDLAFGYHGSASGSILADERQIGLAPYMGMELCTAVETGYSLAYLYQVLGRNGLADRAERTIFNAFPVMFTGNKWAHKYLDQPNQPWALNMTDEHGDVPRVFTTAHTGVATTFGLEPQYPCCTVNHGQGYPKFLSNSWVSVGARGVAHVLLGPSAMSTVMNGSHVDIECDTMYPFSMDFVYSIESEVGFDFYFRVPDWTSGYVAEVAGSSADGQGTAKQEHGLVRFQLGKGKHEVKVSLETAVRTEQRSNKTVSVFYGNMLYALDVGHNATSTLPHAYTDPRGPGRAGFPAAAKDYFVRNTKPWNVAIDPRSIRYHQAGAGAAAAAAAGEHNWQGPIFEPGRAPTHMTVWGCEIEWPLLMGVTPDWAPLRRRCVGGKKQYLLVPYGSANVHMSELPVVEIEDYIS
ncbi:hypothetical protein E4U43_000785 [Claviceps pusilla]|uniref:DUF1680 domain protein n=1 Tax=Claviceps pusilla TaxID=123648 RepID=A0A9P7N9F2_9HYPO|nr:hypothetical protein E4U43_000785 [Claviceps pusilla]